MTERADRETVAIISTGVIGAGWATRFLANGYSVTAWDPAPNAEQLLRKAVSDAWPAIERIGLSANADPQALRVVGSIEEACAGACFVQESAPENLDLKVSLLEQTDAACAPETLIASSTSGLLASDLQGEMQHPDRFVVGHPFNPVYLLPLVEVVGGNRTSETAISKALDFYRDLGMQPLHVRHEIEGHLSDRLLEALWREILHLVNDGVATTGELDDAIIYGPGLRWAFMGTNLTYHLAGGEAGMRHMLEQFGPALKLPWTKLEAPELNDTLIDRMVDGTAHQADGRTIDELKTLRDNCLVDIMQALEKYDIGAGKLMRRRDD